MSMSPVFFLGCVGRTLPWVLGLRVPIDYLIWGQYGLVSGSLDADVRGTYAVIAVPVYSPA